MKNSNLSICLLIILTSFVKSIRNFNNKLEFLEIKISNSLHSFISSNFHSEYRKSNGIKEDHIDHDEIAFRKRSGEILHIPQAERYSSKDWLHNILTMPNSTLMKRIRGTK